MIDVEERLRRLMADERLTLPSPPDVIARVQVAVARRWWRRVAAVLATGVIVVGVPVVVQSGLFAPAVPAPAPSVVPWLNAPTTLDEVEPTPPPARDDARPCTAQDLSGRATTEHGGAAGGHLQTLVHLSNVSASRCTLSGTATLLGVPTKRGTYFDGIGGKQYPATIDPSEQASLDIVTSASCDGPTKTYKDIQLKMRQGVYTLDGLELYATCEVEVGDWYVLRLPEASPPRYAGLGVAIEAPPAVARGAVLKYVVRLSNPGPAPLVLDPCLVYRQGIVKNVGTFRLNCSVHEIPAGGSMRFEMQLSLSPETPGGPARLTWTVIEQGTLGSQASTTVDVTG
jgi:hypothetical protein